MTADTGPKQRKRRGPGQPFQPGQSGNPAGRRPGARNRTSFLALQLMDAEAEPVILALIAARPISLVRNCPRHSWCGRWRFRCCWWARLIQGRALWECLGFATRLPQLPPA
jgi:hypothetical protein